MENRSIITHHLRLRATLIEALIGTGQKEEGESLKGQAIQEAFETRMAGTFND